MNRRFGWLAFTVTTPFQHFEERKRLAVIEYIKENRGPPPKQRQRRQYKLHDQQFMSVGL